MQTRQWVVIHELPRMSTRFETYTYTVGMRLAIIMSLVSTRYSGLQIDFEFNLGSWLIDYVSDVSGQYCSESVSHNQVQIHGKAGHNYPGPPASAMTEKRDIHNVSSAYKLDCFAHYAYWLVFILWMNLITEKVSKNFILEIFGAL